MTVPARVPSAPSHGRPAGIHRRLTGSGKQEIEGRPFTRVAAYLRRHGAEGETLVGSFLVSGEELVLSRQVSCSVGIQGNIPLARAVPNMTIAFGNLRLNGRPVDGLSALAEYPEACPLVRRRLRARERAWS